MYRAEFYKQAARYYKKLDVKTKRRINLALTLDQPVRKDKRNGSCFYFIQKK